MSEPDFTHGYLRVPLPLWLTLYCRGPLTRRQLQLVSVVLRESWGWQTRSGGVHQWTRPLPVRQFAAATGLSTDHLRRDLDALVARGLLRQRGERYQLVGEQALGITRPAFARKWRPLPQKSPARSAESALLPLATKKRERKQRNVTLFPGTRLSPTGDNSSSRSPSRSSEPPTGAAGNSAAASRRLLSIVAAFVGPLSSRQQGLLRRQIRATSVAAVWRTLEPGFRQRGPARLPAWLAGGDDPSSRDAPC